MTDDGSATCVRITARAHTGHEVGDVFVLVQSANFFFPTRFECCVKLRPIALFRHSSVFFFSRSARVAMAVFLSVAAFIT